MNLVGLDSFHTPRTKVNQSYRPEIDGLRALAVAAVIANHFNKSFLPGGYLGVDIFFVISGYVITSSLFNQKIFTLYDFLLGFYFRRLKRLYPALVIMILLTALAFCLVDPQADFTIKSGISALFGYSNLFFVKSSTNYFATSTELNPFLHTWSLGVEEQFYLFFPIIFFYLRLYSRDNKFCLRLALLVSALAFVSLVTFILLFQSDKDLAFFLMPTRFWELSFGVLAFVVNLQTDIKPTSRVRIFTSVFAVGIVGLLFFPVRLEIIATVLIVFFTTFSLVFLKTGSGLAQVLSRPSIVFVGLISYSLYLWHWPVLAFTRWTMDVQGSWCLPLQISAFLGLSLFSYFFVEKPVRINANPLRRIRFIVYQLLILFAGWLVLVSISHYKLYSFLFLGDQKLASQLGGFADFSKTKFKYSAWSKSKCVFSSNHDVGKSVSVEACSLQSFDPIKPTLLVVGNSFDVAQVRMYESLVRRYNVILTSSWGCQLARHLKVQSGWKKSCSFYQDKVVPGLLGSLNPGDGVLLVSDLSTFSSNLTDGLGGLGVSPSAIYVNQKPSSLAVRLLVFDRDLREILSLLSKKHVFVVLQHMTPLTRGLPGPSMCTYLFGNSTTSSRDCPYESKSIHLAARRDLDLVLRGLARDFRNFLIFDPFDLACPGSRCTYFGSDGGLLYRDNAHFSDAFSYRLSFILDQRLSLFLRKYGPT